MINSFLKLENIEKIICFFTEKNPLIEIFFINPFLIPVIEELDSKKCKIRSLRGFFLSALETLDNGKDVEILTTNLKLSFWRNLKTILQQNKKAVLLEFLFRNSQSGHQIRFEEIEEKIQILQN